MFLVADEESTVLMQYATTRPTALLSHQLSAKFVMSRSNLSSVPARVRQQVYQSKQLKFESGLGTAMLTIAA